MGDDGGDLVKGYIKVPGVKRPLKALETTCCVVSPLEMFRL
jgi:hypothetical protein